MILPVVLVVMVTASSFSIQILQDAIDNNKGMASFLSYVEKINQAEKKLKKHAAKMVEKFEEATRKSNGSKVITDINTQLPEEIQIIGFVPDHLEFGCEEGVYIIKIESDLLVSHWSLR